MLDITLENDVVYLKIFKLNEIIYTDRLITLFILKEKTLERWFVSTYQVDYLICPFSKTLFHLTTYFLDCMSGPRVTFFFHLP